MKHFLASWGEKKEKNMSEGKKEKKKKIRAFASIPTH